MSIERPSTGWEIERVTTHPGEVLREDYLQPLGLTSAQLAAGLKLSVELVDRMLREEVSFTPEIALRLSRYFKASAQFWINLQSMHDLTKAKQSTGKQIEAEVQPHAA